MAHALGAHISLALINVDVFGIGIGHGKFGGHPLAQKSEPTLGDGVNIPTRPLKWYWAQTFDMMDGERGPDLTNADAASTPIT